MTMIDKGAHNHWYQCAAFEKSITKLIPISHVNLSNYNRIIMRDIFRICYVMSVLE